MGIAGITVLARLNQPPDFMFTFLGGLGNLISYRLSWSKATNPSIAESLRPMKALIFPECCGNHKRHNDSWELNQAEFDECL
jgi:hypothetical protein